MRSLILIPLFFSAVLCDDDPSFRWEVHPYSGAKCDGHTISEGWNQEQTDQCIQIPNWDETNSFDILGTNTYIYDDSDCQDVITQKDTFQGCATRNDISGEGFLHHFPKAFKVHKMK